MIIFENVRFKNINSVGNYFIDIPLNKYKNIVFVGENGAGKTTVLQAITFVLYGKPFTDIKIGSLINSINKNHLEVEIYFTKGETSYKVRRGLKPDYFEIYQDNVLIKQEAKKDDYQEILNMILGFDFKTFTKVIILGSATHMPFMQLKTAERRDLIEKLLDLEVFSVMNDFTKKDLKELNEKIKSNDSIIYKLELNIETKEKYIDDLHENAKNKIKDHQDNIKVISEQIDELNIKKKELETKLSSVDVEKYNTTLDQLEKALEDIISKETIIKSQNSTNTHKLSFITNNDTCPTCNQSLDESYKQKIKDNTVFIDIEEVLNDKENIKNNISKVKEYISKISKVNLAITEINSNIAVYNKEISFFNEEIRKLNEELLSDHNSDIKELKESLQQSLTEREELKELKTIIDVALIFLKDDGIKSNIIKNYIGVINDLLKKHLENFDFFVNFTLDENFEEEFKSRHVDKFTYLNFSEGEKKRIDLALLLTLKEISRRKNNVSCNLLAFDETLERIDEHGADCFVKILRNAETNNLIISHSDFVINKFNSGHDCVIKVFKKNKFSYYQFLN